MGESYKRCSEIVVYPCWQQLRSLFLLLVSATGAFIVCYLIFSKADTSGVSHEGVIKFLNRKINFSHEQISENTSITRTFHSNVSVSMPRSVRTGNYTFDTFQPISDQKLWVYSAFFDSTETGEPIIKILGIVFRGKRSVYYCHMHERGDVTISTGKWFGFRDSHAEHTNSTAVYLVCGLRQGSRPDFVSVTTNKTEKPTNHLTVLYPGPKVRNITVCYPVLHSLYNEPSKLITSIEINLALGADHAFIYNYSVSRETNYVLEKYQEDGVLTVLQWPLPKGTNTWYYAQNVVINDCVYRNRNVSEYVTILDIDEFIVPVNRSSLVELIQDIMNDYYSSEEHENAPLGSMGFESCIFNRKLPHDIWKQVTNNFSVTKEEEDIITHYSLFPFLYLQRSDPPYKFPGRSKSIVRPDLVTAAGIHNIYALRHGAKQIVTNNKQAIVNHYSITEMRVSERVIDVSILRLKHLLLPRLQLALSRFSEILK